MTETLRSLLGRARTALMREGLSEPRRVWARVESAEVTQSGLVSGELSWSDWRGRYVCTDRSLGYRLDQCGAAWAPSLVAVFEVRLVVRPRYGFQVEVLDIDLLSVTTQSDREP